MAISRMLEGKSVIITGAATGIGQGSAFVFAAHGAKLVLADINETDGEATALRVREGGGEAVFVRADVTRAGDVEALVARAVEAYGRLDCALNNAGIDGQAGATADCSEENWSQTLAVNLTGVFLCMKFELLQMLKQGGGGAIVNTASVAGLVGMGAGLPAYVASKHGVVGLTKSAAAEYAKAGIRVNAVCPGAIRTPLLDHALKQGLMSEEAFVNLHPLGRLGKPEEIGEAAAYMCSERAAFMTGHAMVVDGGYAAV